MDVLGKLLFNGQTIATIPKGKKISNAKEFITLDDGATLQPIYRWMNNDSRDRAVLTICGEVRTMIAFAQIIMESKYLCKGVDQSENVSKNKSENKQENKQENKGSAVDGRLYDKRCAELKKIRSVLIGEITGIENLCVTYEDEDVSGHLKPLISEIEDCVSSIARMLISLGEISDMVDGVRPKNIII